jgi:hypothetical protein
MNAPASILRITLSRRIWRVTLDGAFYGDFRTQRHAADCADAAATALRSQGRTVTIVPPQAQA